MRKGRASIRALAACLTLGCMAPNRTRAAAPVPDLSATTLYTAMARGCQPVDLATWHHPARKILQAAQARVVKVELCENHFPVFTVTLPYDIDGPNDAYFNRLFGELAEANGFWSYALVDLSGDTVITATVQRSTRTVTTSYEAFHASPGTE